MSQNEIDEERIALVQGILIAFASNRQVLPYEQFRRLLGTSMQEIGTLLRAAAKPFLDAGQPDISAIVVGVSGVRSADSAGETTPARAAEEVRRVHDYWEPRRQLDNSAFEQGVGEGALPAIPRRGRPVATSTSSVENCGHDHEAPREVIAALPHSQAGAGRHRCAVCAYNTGLEAGRRTGDRSRS